MQLSYTGLSDFQKKMIFNFMKKYYKKQKARIIQHKLQKCLGGLIKINQIMKVKWLQLDSNPEPLSS